MILPLLSQIFEEKFIVDNRTPVFLFELKDYNVSLLPPMPTLILQVIAMVLFQIAVGFLLGFITYHGIIQRQDEHTKYLLGYGIIIPAILYLPFPFIEFFDIQALALRLGLIAGPLTVTLRCLEAMYGFTPKHAARSLWDYMIHMSFIQYPRVDPKTGRRVPTSLSSIGHGIRTYIKHSMINGVIYSFLIPSNFLPLATSQPDTNIFIATEANQILNTLLAATMISFSLVFSMNGISSIVQLFGGFQTENSVDNPIFGSSSPSDFWGNRWNKVIHRGLKQGVYKPVRMATDSRNLATMAAFVASGIAHEYVWVVMFFRSSHEGDKYVPPFGKSMLFFGWNGVLLVVEHWIGRERWHDLIKPYPRFLVSLMVVLSALPVGHLFTGDFRHGGYFTSLVTAWPMLVFERKTQSQ